MRSRVTLFIVAAIAVVTPLLAQEPSQSPPAAPQTPQGAPQGPLGRHERVHEGVAVIVIDVDLFRRINEMYGHFAGDEVLRLVSARLAASIREIDRVFRFGGEEFAVLLFNAGRESAEVAAERIRLAVAARPMRVNGIDIDVTISAGIATTDDSANAEGLLNAADAALYCAKSTGRNRVVWVGAMA